MKILLLSCHEVLEADELALFRELGHEVFSPGSFVNPQNRGDNLLRPGIEGLTYDPEILTEWHSFQIPGKDGKTLLTPKFCARFDVAIVHHVPEWILGNAAAFAKAGIPVVWRTIGQSIDKQEASLKPLRDIGFPLHIVRYSPMEEQIPGFIGQDAMIRFAKRESEWAGWTGDVTQVLHIAQDPILRDKACNWSFFEKVTQSFPRMAIGGGTEAVRFGVGKVPFDELKMAMRRNRVLFYTGTHPASYTLGFIEALMTGIPVVSIGNIHGNSPDIPGHKLFEVPYLLNGSNGFASDDPYELQDFIRECLGDPHFAEAVGSNGRETAKALFGWDLIKSQWEQFLKRFE